MFSKYFVGKIGKIYQSLIRRVFTIPGAFAMPDVQATTNFIRPMLSCCSELIPNSPNETCCCTRHKPNETSRCTRWPLSQLTLFGHVINKTSHCTQWPLSILTHCGHVTRSLTHCGHKPNKPSQCTWWPLRQINKPNETSRCTRWPLSQLTLFGHVINKTSHCTQWPLSILTHCGHVTRSLTHCGHKPNKPSQCTWWPLHQINLDVLPENTVAFVGRKTSSTHDQVLTNTDSNLNLTLSYRIH